jgi:hypothetical protein
MSTHHVGTKRLQEVGLARLYDDRFCTVVRDGIVGSCSSWLYLEDSPSLE